MMRLGLSIGPITRVHGTLLLRPMARENSNADCELHEDRIQRSSVHISFGSARKTGDYFHYPILKGGLEGVATCRPVSDFDVVRPKKNEPTLGLQGDCSTAYNVSRELSVCGAIRQGWFLAHSHSPFYYILVLL